MRCSKRDERVQKQTVCVNIFIKMRGSALLFKKGQKIKYYSYINVFMTIMSILRGSVALSVTSA